MEHQIHKRDVYDIPIKTQLTVNVVVFGDITQQSLNDLLDSLYTIESQQSGFQYRDFLSHIFIYLYASAEHANSGMAQWIAMLSKAGVDEEIKKTFNEGQIKRLNMPEEDKFNLTEAERRDVWKEIVTAGRQAIREADEYYPIDPSRSEQFGQTLVIERRTPLMPSLASPSSIEDLSSLISEMTQLQPNTNLLVTHTQNIRNITWYLVEARTPEGDFLGKGWVNGIALMGQTHMSTLGQIESNQEIKNRIQTAALRQISEINNLTIDQIHEISVEGSIKNWPFPSEAKY